MAEENDKEVCNEKVNCDIPCEHLPAVLKICDLMVFAAYSTMLPVGDFTELVYKYMTTKDSFRVSK
jgi:hypothetical protein